MTRRVFQPKILACLSKRKDLSQYLVGGIFRVNVGAIAPRAIFLWVKISII